MIQLLSNTTLFVSIPEATPNTNHSNLGGHIKTHPGGRLKLFNEHHNLLLVIKINK